MIETKKKMKVDKKKIGLKMTLFIFFFFLLVIIFWGFSSLSYFLFFFFPVSSNDFFHTKQKRDTSSQREREEEKKDWLGMLTVSSWVVLQFFLQMTQVLMRCNLDCWCSLSSSSSFSFFPFFFFLFLLLSVTFSSTLCLCFHPVCVDWSFHPLFPGRMKVEFSTIFFSCLNQDQCKWPISGMRERERERREKQKKERKK